MTEREEAHRIANHEHVRIPPYADADPRYIKSRPDQMHSAPTIHHQ
jgi:hypothetical protein